MIDSPPVLPDLPDPDQDIANMLWLRQWGDVDRDGTEYVDPSLGVPSGGSLDQTKAYNPDEPRDERGRWTEDGGGNPVVGLPRDVAVPPDSRAARVLSGDHFALTATQPYDGTHAIAMTPRLSGNQKPVPGRDDKFYDADLATTEPMDPNFPSLGHVAKPNVAGTGYTTDLPASHEPGTLWRGMSYEEMQSIKRTGTIASHGGYNVGDPEIGKTYYADDPQMADSYANGIAPWQAKPSFDRPSYLIGVKSPGAAAEFRQAHIPGEVGLAPLPASAITDVIEMRPYAVQAGETELRQNSFGEWNDGSGSAPDAHVVYKRLAQVADAKKYSPDQPRVPSGSAEGGQFAPDDHGDREGGDGREPAHTPVEKPENPGAAVRAVYEAQPRHVQERIAYATMETNKALQRGNTSFDRFEHVDGKWGTWEPERWALQQSIIDDHLAAAGHIPNDHKAIIAGGLPGAGKSTLIDKHYGSDGYMVVSSDDIKEDLIRRGGGITAGGLSPLEGAALLHDESSYVAERLFRRATATGKNVVRDITMTSAGPAYDVLNRLKSQKYDTTAMFVDVPLRQAASSVISRYIAGQSAWAAGSGLGGRLVPLSYIVSSGDASGKYQSRARSVFESMKPKFDHWTLIDNEHFAGTVVDAHDNR